MLLVWRVSEGPAAVPVGGSNAGLRRSESAVSRGNIPTVVARVMNMIGGAAPVTWRYTRYVALHPLRGAAPEQKGCNAYGSGVAHALTSRFAT